MKLQQENMRARVASHLKSLIGALTIASIGEKPKIESRLNELLKMGGVGKDIIGHIEQRAGHPDQSRRYFAVGFRDGGVRAVFPADTDPLGFKQQIVAMRSPVEDDGQTLGQLESIDVFHPSDRRTPVV